MMFKINRSLGVRGIVIFCSCLVLILSGMTAINVLYQKQILEKMAEDHVQELGKLILTAMAYPMMSGDQDVIQKQFDMYNTFPELTVAHLTDKTGIIRRSTDRMLIGQKPSSPYLQSALNGKAYVGFEFRKRSNNLMITELVPIFNEKKCFACHGSKDKVLGVVRLGIDWERSLAVLGQARKWNIVLSLTGLLGMSVLIALFFMRLVVLPIRQLEMGMRKVTQGDLELRIEKIRNDEIGNLTEIFNKMTIELARAMDDEQRKSDALKDLNQNLRGEIAERSKAELALQESKQRLADIIDFLPDPTFVIDLDGKVIAWNKAIEKMTSRNAADVLGKGNYEYALPFYNTRRPILVDVALHKDMDIEKEYISFAKGERAVTGEVFSPFLNNGKGAYLWAIATPLYGAGGKVVGAIESVRDISQIKQVEDQLRKAYEELKHVQGQLLQTAKMASVGSLAGGVAHEINNPLTGVLNNVQLINMLMQEKGEFKVDDFKELLGAIEESAQRCVKITRALLDFSHASKGVYQPVNMNEVVGKVMSFVGHDLQLENIVIKTELEPSLPDISADAQLMQQIVFDVISNARWAIKKKSNSGEGSIIIKTRSGGSGNEIVVTISDTGIGIPKENLDKIFEPFFTTKEVGEGTGLGLSLVYSIVKEHHGRIEVASEVGQGTSFVITFPVFQQATITFKNA